MFQTKNETLEKRIKPTTQIKPKNKSNQRRNKQTQEQTNKTVEKNRPMHIRTIKPTSEQSNSYPKNPRRTEIMKVKMRFG